MKEKLSITLWTNATYQFNNKRHHHLSKVVIISNRELLLRFQRPYANLFSWLTNPAGQLLHDNFGVLILTNVFYQKIFNSIIMLPWAVISYSKSNWNLFLVPRASLTPMSFDKVPSSVPSIDFFATRCWLSSLPTQKIGHGGPEGYGPNYPCTQPGYSWALECLRTHSDLCRSDHDLATATQLCWGEVNVIPTKQITHLDYHLYPVVYSMTILEVLQRNNWFQTPVKIGFCLIHKNVKLLL